MIGSLPTVGCLVLLHEGDYTLAVEGVLALLEASLLVKFQGRVKNKWLIKANVGGSEVEGFLMSLSNDEEVMAVFIEFDEEDCVKIATQNQQSLEYLLLPYVDVLKQVPGATAVGLGWETSIPTDYTDASLESAGIAVIFQKDEQKQTEWHRRDVYRLI